MTLPELEFAEGVGVGVDGLPDVAVGSAVEEDCKNAPVSPEAAGKVSLVEPVPAVSIFCPSIVISIIVSLAFCSFNS